VKNSEILDNYESSVFKGQNETALQKDIEDEIIEDAEYMYDRLPLDGVQVQDLWRVILKQNEAIQILKSRQRK